jgi:hypothetical protein
MGCIPENILLLFTSCYRRQGYPQCHVDRRVRAGGLLVPDARAEGRFRLRRVITGGLPGGWDCRDTPWWMRVWEGGSR